MLITSCTGGGGMGSGDVSNNPNGNFLASIAEPAAPGVAADWSGSEEYANSTGLAQLKAAEGYASRSGGLPGGQGVRIAIIDSGIDVSHADLGNLLDQSWSAGGEALRGESHGTFVAGIAGARRTQSDDPNDMHGIAYRATLVNFQTARPSITDANGYVSFSSDDLVDAIRAASGLEDTSLAVESDILNLSLGAYSSNDNTFADLKSAMVAAAARNKIMVLAAGNEGLSTDPDRRLQPIYPAAYADDPGIAGLAIVVGNLNGTGQAAPSSSFCGDTKDYCLFAPGSSIRSTLPGDRYGTGSGTSFAVPYVSGAAAVVKAAFPGVSNTDVVDRLLLTAADLGDPGVDSVYGRGRLDLEAAMSPVGPTGFPIGPTVDGPLLAAGSSALRLGSGLALDGQAETLLARAMAVDEMGFPFPIDLGRGVATTARGTGLAGFVEGGTTSTAATGIEAMRLSAIVPKDEFLDLAAPFPVEAPHGRERSDGSVPLRFESGILGKTGMMERATVFASIHGGSRPRLGLEDDPAEQGPSWLEAGRFFSPYDRLAGEGGGAGLHVLATDGTEFALSTHFSMENEGPETSLQRLEIATAGPMESVIHVAAGFLQEDDGFMGGRARGAFGEGMSARSQFLTLSARGPLTETIDWFGTYSRGQTSIDNGGAALIGDWSDARSEAFGVGIDMDDVVKPGDDLRLMVGQPLRHERAQATITLPVARRENGDVVTATERVDLASKGREIMTEIGYRLPLDERGAHLLQTVAFLRLDPDHDRARKPDAGLGMRYRWQF